MTDTPTKLSAEELAGIRSRRAEAIDVNRSYTELYIEEYRTSTKLLNHIAALELAMINKAFQVFDAAIKETK